MGGLNSPAQHGNAPWFLIGWVHIGDAAWPPAMRGCLQARRGEQLEHVPLAGGRVLLRYCLPLSELAGSDLHGEVKARTQG